MATFQDDDLIVIDTQLFHKKWKELFEIPIPSVYSDKIEELKNTYSCFRIKTIHHTKHTYRGAKYRDSNERSHRVNNGNIPITGTGNIDTPIDESDFPAVRYMRPRIGVLFTNTEGKARKNFISFMNKLSPQNKDGILHNFIRSLVPENIHIYIDQIILLFQIQPTYHELYMEVLYEIIRLSPEKATELLEENFEEFMKEEKMMIPESIASNLKDLNTSSDQLDQMCEYVQWKKKTKGLITFYIHCLSDKLYGRGDDLDIEMLFHRIAWLVGKFWDYEAHVDIYLDIALHALDALYKYYPTGLTNFKDTRRTYLEWEYKKDTLKPSSKFKVMDIIDILRRRGAR